MMIRYPVSAPCYFTELTRLFIGGVQTGQIPTSQPT